MRTALASLKRSLFGLVGVMALAAVSFSATVPHSLWLMEQDGYCWAGNPCVKPALHNAVIDGHARRSQAAKGLRRTASKPMKTKNSMDRKTAPATLALTGCKDNAPADGTSVIAEGKSTSRKTYSTQEKSLCNPESPRSR
jgi:hypothetical protein